MIEREPTVDEQSKNPLRKILSVFGIRLLTPEERNARDLEIDDIISVKFTTFAPSDAIPPSTWAPINDEVIDHLLQIYPSDYDDERQLL